MKTKIFPNQACLVSTLILLFLVALTAAWPGERARSTTIGLHPTRSASGGSELGATVLLLPESAFYRTEIAGPETLWTLLHEALERAASTIGGAGGTTAPIAFTAWADDGSFGSSSPSARGETDRAGGPSFSLTHVVVAACGLLLLALTALLIRLHARTRKAVAGLAAIEDANEKLRREVVDLRAEEHKLRESEKKYRQIVEHINEIVLTVDGRGAITFISPAVQPASGYRPSEVVGSAFSRFIHPQDLHRVEDYFEKLKMGFSDPIDCRVLARNGEARWVHLSSRRILEGDRFEGIQVTLTDIANRKWIEHIVEESEQKFRRIVEQSADGIVIVDERGVITEWNKGEERISGVPRDRAVGRMIWDVEFSLVPAEERSEEGLEKLKDAVLFPFVNGQAAEVVQERHILRPDGELRTVQSTLFLIRTDAGLMLGRSSRDVSGLEANTGRTKTPLS